MKRIRKERRDSFMRAVGVKHQKLCASCSVDCEVNRKADKEFWANNLTTTAPYSLKSCPKMTKCEAFGIKGLKRLK